MCFADDRCTDASLSCCHLTPAKSSWQLLLSGLQVCLHPLLELLEIYQISPERGLCIHPQRFRNSSWPRVSNFRVIAFLSTIQLRQELLGWYLRWLHYMDLDCPRQQRIAEKWFGHGKRTGANLSDVPLPPEASRLKHVFKGPQGTGGGEAKKHPSKHQDNGLWRHNHTAYASSRCCWHRGMQISDFRCVGPWGKNAGCYALRRKRRANLSIQPIVKLSLCYGCIINVFVVFYVLRYVSPSVRMFSCILYPNFIMIYAIFFTDSYCLTLTFIHNTNTPTCNQLNIVLSSYPLTP